MASQSSLGRRTGGTIRLGAKVAAPVTLTPVVSKPASRRRSNSGSHFSGWRNRWGRNRIIAITLMNAVGELRSTVVVLKSPPSMAGVTNGKPPSNCLICNSLPAGFQRLLRCATPNATDRRFNVIFAANPAGPPSNFSMRRRVKVFAKGRTRTSLSGQLLRMALPKNETGWSPRRWIPNSPMYAKLIPRSAASSAAVLRRPDLRMSQSISDNKMMSGWLNGGVCSDLAIRSRAKPLRALNATTFSTRRSDAAGRFTTTARHGCVSAPALNSAAVSPVGSALSTGGVGKAQPLSRTLFSSSNVVTGDEHVRSRHT